MFNTSYISAKKPQPAGRKSVTKFAHQVETVLQRLKLPLRDFHQPTRNL